MVGKSLVSVESKSWLYHPAFPKHWERCQLYSLARWVNGLAFRDIQFSESGKPVIKIAEIKGGISSQTKFTTQNFDESVHVRPGDLLFSWSGQPETSIDVFWWRGPDGWLNQHTFRVTPGDGIDATFFFYLLRYLKPNFIGIARNKQTTGLGHVTKRDLENIEAAVPRLPEQRAIAHILGTLDDKIELNRRMSETLEGMARTLFKSWFVDFDPVRAKMEGRWKKGQSLPGLPANLYDLFPSRLINSELGEIPEGWRVGSVGSLCDSITSGGTPARMIPLYWEGGSIPWFKTGELFDGPLIESEELITQAALDGSSCKLWPAGTILFALYASPTVGRLGVLTRPGTSNQAAAGLIAKSTIGVPFLRRLLLAARVKLQTIAVGAAQQNINQAVLKAHRVVIPTEKAASSYSRLVLAADDRQVALRKEAKALAALRDVLLPKLISGHLSVAEVVKKSNGLK